MKIVITGATGFVGRLLTPKLVSAGHTLLLVGRNPEKLRELFPDLQTCDYSDLSKAAAGYDVLVHLATLNNDAQGTDREFIKVNVDFLLDIAHLADQAEISRFINVSSIHAIDVQNVTPYAVSKRKGGALLEETYKLMAETVFLPYIYGDQWSGKLKFLNKLSTPIANLVFKFFAALKPTVNVEKLVVYINNPKVTSHGEEIILYDDQNDNIVYKSLKRLIDICFAISILLLFGWLLILVWIVIKLESKGPGVFAQPRVGEQAKTFTCYKFRTMQRNTAQRGTHEISASSVTKIGAFLRKTKIDELPQIFNILRNEMSLIGPRPCLPSQDEVISARGQSNVFLVKPGISGLAQVNGIDMSVPRKLAQWDSRYISTSSIISDVKLIIATVRGRGQGDRTKKGSDINS